MSNQTPQGAKQYTAEEAAQIVARVKSGLPPDAAVASVPTKVTTEAETKAAAPTEPPAKPADFEVINPPLGVYQPNEPGDTIMGYLLAVQVDAVSGAAFYVLKLTEESAHIFVGASFGDKPTVGDHVAIYDAPTLKAMRSLMPQYDHAGNCIAATEVIVAPHRRNPFGWDYLVQARRVLRPAADRPGFACVPDMPPRGDTMDAAGIIQDSGRTAPGIDESGE